MSDDWDTSANEEAPADKYNKSSFGGDAQSPKEKEEEEKAPPAAAMAELSVNEADAAEQDDAAPEQQPEPAPPASLPVENLEEAAAAAAPAPAAPAPEEPKSANSAHGRSPARGRRASGGGPADAPAFLREAHEGSAFTEKLSPEALAFFNELCEKPFAEQAVSFLNAYWNEVGPQSEFIFSVAYPTMRYADMHAKGVEYIHLYEEGNDLDFNIGLYFYEKLCKKVLDDDEGKPWREDPQWAASVPEFLTAIKRKIELREKVDCNFDGRVSFLEYLLYQYREHANPADFTHRAMKHDAEEEHPEIAKARAALAEATQAIREYEAEKHRLEQLAAQPGVKGLGAKHQLAILDASPLAERLNKSLITAEAAVRIAARKFGGGKAAVPSAGGAEGAQTMSEKPTQGSIWWLSRDLEEKQKLYGKRRKA